MKPDFFLLNKWTLIKYIIYNVNIGESYSYKYAINFKLKYYYLYNSINLCIFGINYLFKTKKKRQHDSFQIYSLLNFL